MKAKSIISSIILFYIPNQIYTQPHKTSQEKKPTQSNNIPHDSFSLFYFLFFPLSLPLGIIHIYISLYTNNNNDNCKQIFPVTCLVHRSQTEETKLSDFLVSHFVFFCLFPLSDCLPSFISLELPIGALQSE